MNLKVWLDLDFRRRNEKERYRVENQVECVVPTGVAPKPSTGRRRKQRKVK